MNLKRQELKNKELNDLLEIVNNRYGLTNGNSLISREMIRIYNKLFTLDIILYIKREAALRILSGQEDREFPLENYKIIKTD